MHSVTMAKIVCILSSPLHFCQHFLGGRRGKIGCHINYSLERKASYWHIVSTVYVSLTHSYFRKERFN